MSATTLVFMKTTAHVLMRSLQFRDGSTAAYPMAIFTDAVDAKREGDNAARAFAGMHDAVKQVMSLIGIAQLGHRVVEVPVVEGAGLVVVTHPPLGPMSRTG